MIKSLKILAIFLIISLPLLSQQKIGTVTGSVVDKATGKPIEGADVSLLGEKDSALIKRSSTNASGKFILGELPPGRFFIRANLVGYNFAVVSGITINRDNPAVDLQPIKLTQGETTTEEITVEGEKNLIELRPDKKVFNISKNLTTQGATLLDLLKDIPSVTVDQDGNVSLRGSEAVKITIDGRQSGLEGQNRNIILEQIPANEVESIELITNPSAKFEAEGSAGIINVVLKKDKEQALGYNGSVGLNIGTGDKYSGQLGFNLKKNKVSINGSYNYNLRNMTFDGFSNLIYLNSTSIGEISRESSDGGRNKSHSVKLGLDYFPDQRNTLGISANFRKPERTHSGKTISREYDPFDNLTADYFTTSNDLDKGYTFDINANYMLKFKTPSQVLTADISFSKDKDDETEENFDTYITPQNPTPNKRIEYSNEIHDDIVGKIDYVHPFSKDIKLEAGYRGSYTKRDNDFRVDNYDYSLNQYITDLGQSNRFIHKQQVHGLYGIYTQQLGNFGFSLGGRAEQTITKGELLTTNQVFDRSYINFFPSASISQKITKSTEVQLSYTRRINRPRQRQLNPFRSLMGSNNYSEGNPNLNPEFTDALEFNFIQYFPWATITPGIFYRYTKDEISRTRTLLDSVSTLSTFVNLNKSKSYGGELIVSSQPAKFINFNGTFSYFRREVDASNIQSGLTNAASTWSARGMSTITLPADLSLQLTYFYTGKRVIANGIIDPFQSFDAAVKKDLFDNKLSITLRASDIFNTAKFVTNFDDIEFREYSERVRDSRGLFLNITYKFGDQEKKQRDRKRKENEENEDEDFEY